MYCTMCGKELPPEAESCSDCGHIVSPAAKSGGGGSAPLPRAAGIADTNQAKRHKLQMIILTCGLVGLLLLMVCPQFDAVFFDGHFQDSTYSHTIFDLSELPVLEGYAANSWRNEVAPLMDPDIYPPLFLACGALAALSLYLICKKDLWLFQVLPIGALIFVHTTLMSEVTEATEYAFAEVSNGIGYTLPLVMFVVVLALSLYRATLKPNTPTPTVEKRDIKEDKLVTKE